MPRIYTYGPFKSRRLGLSLGVDILPKCKKCSYNCVYCELGITKPNQLVSPEYMINIEPKNSFQKELSSILKYVKNLDSITFGYTGEPTLNKNLDEFFKIAKSVRNEINWKKKKPKLTLFTNSSTLHQKKVRDIVKDFDIILAKLDAANQEDFLRTNRPHKDVLSIDKIINSIAKLKSELSHHHELAIQCLLYQSYKKEFISNNNIRNFESLTESINKINPDIVQLYSIARIPAEYYVYALGENMLKEISNKLKRKIPSSVKINYY
ncbi:MAG: radical SAM protein [Promethearchaeota archaeon]|nr:MAG: radical SAM protein [Candidatus Lokiarchaeota archaeon]